MITLDQVRALEARVEKALGAMERLGAENAALRESVSKEKERAADLERTIEEYRRDQNRIEQGILHALERLNAFEDAVLESSAPAQKPVVNGAAVPKAHAAAPSRPAVSSQEPATVTAASPAAPESSSSAKDGASPESGTAEAELEIF